jgi:carbonic anhydrase
MSKVLSDVLAANAKYSEDFGAKSRLALPPAKRTAILTCMDARLDPAKFAGLSEGDAHIIRNAGGRASDDAIRSLVISYKLLGTSEFSSSITPSAACCISPTRSCAVCSPPAWKPRS